MSFFRLRGWETDALFPASPSMGPRNEYDSNGGSPGEHIFNYIYFNNLSFMVRTIIYLYAYF